MAAVPPTRAAWGRQTASVQALLLIHAAATVAMAGIAWFVQVVHYPLFALVGDEFAAYEARHAERTTLVVAPLMTIEALAAVLIVIRAPGVLTAVGLALVALLWLATAVVQVPCHRRLAQGFDAGVHRRLVATNWLRTVAWTARAGLAFWLLH